MPLFLWSSGAQRGVSLTLMLVFGVLRVWYRTFNLLKELSGEELAQTDDLTVIDVGNGKAASVAAHARYKAAAAGRAAANGDGAAEARPGAAPPPTPPR